MFKNNLKTAQLARVVNIPQQTLQRITSGQSPHPHNATLKPLAAYFTISINQLKGMEPITWLNTDNTKLHKNPDYKKVVIIPWKKLSEQINHPDKNNHTDMVYTDAKVSAHAFALKMYDYSMEPIFPKNTILIFDPNEPLTDRCYVIAKLSDHPLPTFRQLFIDSSHNYLKALSPDFIHAPLIELSSQDQIYGVLMQAKTYYYATT